MELINCEFAGEVCGENSVAGIIGEVKGNQQLSVKNCQTSGKIAHDGGLYSSGIAGIIGIAEVESCIIEDCTNRSKIPTTKNISSVGGVCGWIQAVSSVTISNSKNYEIVQCYSHGGGIAGRIWANEVEIENCSNANIVGTVDKSYEIGGIAGRLDVSSGTVSMCNNFGQFIAAHRAGGIVGDCEGNVAITRCSNTGSGVPVSSGEYYSVRWYSGKRRQYIILQ